MIRAVSKGLHTSSHHLRVAAIPLSFLFALHTSYAFASVNKSPDPLENDCRTFAASSRLPGGEKKGLLTAMVDAMVTVADKHPNTDPRTISFEHLKSAGIAAMCRP